MSSSEEYEPNPVRYNIGFYSGILGCLFAFLCFGMLVFQLYKKIDIVKFMTLLTFLIMLIVYSFYFVSFTSIYPYSLDNDLRKVWLTKTGVPIVLLSMLSTFLVFYYQNESLYKFSSISMMTSIISVVSTL